MTDHHAAQPHGDIQEVFPDVFFVTGTMKTVLMGGDWHFSRNMTIVREGQDLTLINTVRLDDAGLAQLEALGQVKNVVRIGSLHGIDDHFYKTRYAASLWELPAMPSAEGLSPDNILSVGGEMPFAGASLFVFEATKLPECIVRIDRAGGILVACDSLQNWEAPNEFFSEASRTMMQDMGFFQRANIGPVWMKVNDPQAADFARLRALEYRHALCGHGSPLLDNAKEAFEQRFQQVFAV